MGKGALLAQQREVELLTDLEPEMRHELGLCVDRNGICYLNDYEGSGICVCGTLVGGVVQAEVPNYISTFIERYDLIILPRIIRERIALLSPAERLQYIEL
jgi:hypothetical protein